MLINDEKQLFVLVLKKTYIDKYWEIIALILVKDEK